MKRLTFSLFLLLVHSAIAQLQVADIFTDHAVLQQGTEVPVWGKADAGATVSVSFAGQKKETVAGKDGQWKLTLHSLKPSYDPASLIIQSNESKITLSDILVGEVWICSGQSNMAMRPTAIPQIKDLASKAKNIRSFEVPRMVAFDEQVNLEGQWKPVAPDTAVGSSFAHFLQQHADVPIGIIHASWGSSGIEAWMPRDMVDTVPHFKTIMEEFDADKNTQQKIKAILAKQPWSKKDDIFLRRQSNLLYNAMIHPIAPFACRGLVWYQGERNTQSLYGMVEEPWFSRNSGMLKYGHTLKEWIKRYRKQWNNDQMHFLTVMLPRCYSKPLSTGPQQGHNHPESHSWAWMRESQLQSLELEHTSVANTIDLGALKNIHPKDKLPIGKRLALLAARDTLAKDIVAQGPTMKKVEQEAGKLIVHFDHAKGLKTMDNNAPSGFWIADESANWIQADATIKNDTVILTSASLKNPKWVRYAFTGFPTVNLVNEAQLPAYPFRSDQLDPNTALKKY